MYYSAHFRNGGQQTGVESHHQNFSDAQQSGVSSHRHDLNEANDLRGDRNYNQCRFPERVFPFSHKGRGDQFVFGSQQQTVSGTRGSRHSIVNGNSSFTRFQGGEFVFSNGGNGHQSVLPSHQQFVFSGHQETPNETRHLIGNGPSLQWRPAGKQWRSSSYMVSSNNISIPQERLEFPWCMSHDTHLNLQSMRNVHTGQDSCSCSGRSQNTRVDDYMDLPHLSFAALKEILNALPSHPILQREIAPLLDGEKFPNLGDLREETNVSAPTETPGAVGTPSLEGTLPPIGSASPPEGTLPPIGTPSPPEGTLRPIGTPSPPGGTLPPIGSASPPERTLPLIGSGSPLEGTLIPIGSVSPPEGTPPPPEGTTPPEGSPSPSEVTPLPEGPVSAGPLSTPTRTLSIPSSTEGSSRAVRSLAQSKNHHIETSLYQQDIEFLAPHLVRRPHPRVTRKKPRSENHGMVDSELYTSRSNDAKVFPAEPHTTPQSFPGPLPVYIHKGAESFSRAIGGRSRRKNVEEHQVTAKSYQKDAEPTAPQAVPKTRCRSARKRSRSDNLEIADGELDPSGSGATKDSSVNPHSTLQPSSNSRPGRKRRRVGDLEGPVKKKDGESVVNDLPGVSVETHVEKRPVKKRIRENKFKCPDCPKKFDSNYRVRQHMTAHSDFRQYLCHICGVAFKRLCHFSDHVKRHSNKRHYSCRHCDQGFGRPREHLVHVMSSVCQREAQHKRRLEDGEIECVICGKKGFKDHQNFVRHVRVHGARNDLICCVCSTRFKFNQTSCLVKHAREEHSQFLESMSHVRAN